MKLNGLQRLWVFVSALYLCVVSVYVGFTLPGPADIPHSERFYAQLRPEVKEKIGWIEPTQKFHSEKWIRPSDLFPKQQSVGLPNGHTIYFKGTVPEKEMQEVAKDYWRIVEKEARQRRLHYVLIALLFWGGPVIALYVLGWSVGWVQRGFKKQ